MDLFSDILDLFEITKKNQQQDLIKLEKEISKISGFQIKKL